LETPRSSSETQARVPSAKAATQFIIALGLISLFADVTYEGARSINGPFLAQLGAGAAVIGIVSGAGELAGYILRLVSGTAADRTHAYWPITIAGYVINLCAVPLMTLSNHWIAASALIIAERAGKGIRTPARDVMLSQASNIIGRGWGFGLHEFMDQLGAFAGPLMVALVVSQSHEYSRAYALLAFPAALALATLFASIKAYPDPSRFEEPKPHEAARHGGFPREFWIYVIAGGLLAAGFVDYPLMAFHFEKANVVSPSVIPVFYSVAMGVEALMALLFGRLYDRIGTTAVIIGAALSAMSSPLVFFGSFYPALAGVALWGAGMGAQQSALRARIAEIVPSERRGSAYGIFNTVYGVLWFAGSSAIGILYGRSMDGAVSFAVVAQFAAMPLLWSVRRKSV